MQIHEKRPQKVKNFGVWICYDSRSGTHNMYKEYREMSRTAAIESMYADMAARHRARFRSIHVRRSIVSLTPLTTTDSEAGRAAEDGRPAAAVHQAAREQGPQVPDAAPRAELDQEEDVHVQPSGDVLLRAWDRCYGCYGIMFTCIAVKCSWAK
jgi:ribosomal protein L20A (L18A)